MTETPTLRHLCDAYDARELARKGTRSGITDDDIQKAQTYVRSAMRLAVADDVEDGT